jgi:exosome complex component RRP46
MDVDVVMRGCSLAHQNLPILPSLLQTAVLALLSASIPLAETLTSVLLALTSDGKSQSILRNPTLTELQSADSVHVLGFTAHGELLVAESEGSFTIDDWNEVFEAGKRLCCDDIETVNDDDVMQDDISGEKAEEAAFLKSVVREKVVADLHWKE